MKKKEQSYKVKINDEDDLEKYCYYCGSELSLVPIWSVQRYFLACPNYKFGGDANHCYKATFITLEPKYDVKTGEKIEGSRRL